MLRIDIKLFSNYLNKTLSNQVLQFVSKRTNKKEELHTKAPLLLHIRIIIFISKKVVKKVVIRLIYIAM